MLQHAIAAAAPGRNRRAGHHGRRGNRAAECVGGRSWFSLRAQGLDAARLFSPLTLIRSLYSPTALGA
jgi:hypothetical protein